jgi:predicted 3-demethylubiquinone-9 3-methyltransferase (glyoxalase superfamily)
MQKITPSLWFENQCEEAMNLYVSVFNSSPAKKVESKIVSIKRYPNEPLEGLPMEGLEGKVLTGIFELEGQRFVALDGGPIFKPNAAISFMIECDTQEEVDHYWNKLSEGGDPNAQQCGWLQDKFGFSWQVVPKILGELIGDPDKEKSDRVLQAMLKMKKIVIEDIKQAAQQ